MKLKLQKFIWFLICCCIVYGCILVSCTHTVQFVRDDVLFEKPIETESELFFIDQSQKELGYVLIYTPANWFIVMNKLDSEFEKTIFDAKNETQSYKIPLSYGNGTYEFNLFDSSMQLIHTETVSIDNIKDEILYTMSNDVINFDSSDLVSLIASEAYTKAPSNNDYLIIVNQYVHNQITYDEDRRDLDMFVTVDNILTRSYGVCYEYSKLLTALLRIKNVPCKMVFGDYDKTYHAWCEVYLNDQWIIADPTLNNITSIDDILYTNRVKIY